MQEIPITSINLAQIKKDEDLILQITDLLKDGNEDNVGVSAMRRAQKISKETGLSDMSIEEINTEISKTRV